MRQKGFAPLLIILIIAIAGVLGFAIYKFGPLDIQISKKETSSPTPTPDTTSKLSKYTFENCGSTLPKVGFSLNPPAGWSASPTEGSEIYQIYRYQKGGSWIDITCGDGFGGGCESQDKTTLTINNQTVNACYTRNGNKANLWGTYLASPNSDVAFSFTSNLADKKLLDQILSTFKFAD